MNLLLHISIKLDQFLIVHDYQVLYYSPNYMNTKDYNVFFRSGIELKCNQVLLFLLKEIVLVRLVKYSPGFFILISILSFRKETIFKRRNGDYNI